MTTGECFTVGQPVMHLYYAERGVLALRLRRAFQKGKPRCLRTTFGRAALDVQTKCVGPGSRDPEQVSVSRRSQCHLVIPAGAVRCGQPQHGDPTQLQTLPRAKVAPALGPRGD